MCVSEFSCDKLTCTILVIQDISTKYMSRVTEIHKMREREREREGYNYKARSYLYWVKVMFEGVIHIEK